MSRVLFIHDFYRDGYSDMLAEVRILQEGGQWTSERRAHWTKRAVSEYEGVRHKYPRMDTSYWAGRLAAIKSSRTAPPKPRTETYDQTVFFALPDSTGVWCLECEEKATWECSTHGLMTYLCDRCKQERVRELTAYITPDGWDWDEHEEDQLLPFPVGQFDKLTVKEQPHQASIFLPSALIIGSVFLEVALHLSFILFILEFLVVAHFMMFHKELLEEFRKLFESER